MKRLDTFKGYATETGFDEKGGSFITSTVMHPFAASQPASDVPKFAARVAVLKPHRRKPMPAGRPPASENAA